MQVVARINNRSITFGGEPPNTPARSAIVDIRIENDGHGYLLICEFRNTPDSWDTWHGTLEDAIQMANGRSCSGI